MTTKPDPDDQRHQAVLRRSELKEVLGDKVDTLDDPAVARLHAAMVGEKLIKGSAVTGDAAFTSSGVDGYRDVLADSWSTFHHAKRDAASDNAMVARQGIGALNSISWRLRSIADGFTKPGFMQDDNLSHYRDAAIFVESVAAAAAQKGR